MYSDAKNKYFSEKKGFPKTIGVQKTCFRTLKIIISLKNRRCPKAKVVRKDRGNYGKSIYKVLAIYVIA